MLCEVSCKLEIIELMFIHIIYFQISNKQFIMQSGKGHIHTKYKGFKKRSLPQTLSWPVSNTSKCLSDLFQNIRQEQSTTDTNCVLLSTKDTLSSLIIWLTAIIIIMSDKLQGLGLLRDILVKIHVC